MNILRILLATLGFAVFLIGCLMALPDERAAGSAFIIAGAIIIVGVLISAAIVEARK